MRGRSISDMLADVGIRHEPSNIEGKRDLYDSSGQHLGTFDVLEAAAYLRANGAPCQLLGRVTDKADGEIQ